MLTGSVFDADLREVAASVVPAFLESRDEARVSFLADRLNASFYFHLLSLDPKASELVREHVSDKILYLDTNFVYRLLGFHGPALAFGPATVASLAGQLSCRLIVAEESINEFVRALRSDTYRIRHIPLSYETYRKVAAQHPSDQWSFMQMFYREWLGGRVKDVEEFERKYSNVRALLEGWKIGVEESAYLTDEERASQEHLDLLAALDRWHNGKRHPNTVAHDAFLLSYVRRARGSTDSTPGRIKYWLLTYDQGLARYCIYHATAARLPESMLADDWLQLTRPFLPRTSEYEQAFVAMLRHPLAYHKASAVPLDHVVEALSRLEKFEELPERLVVAMVADQEFVRRLRKAPSDEASREILDVKLTELAAAASLENKELRSRIEASEGKISALEDSLRGSQAEKAKAVEETQAITLRSTRTLEQERNRRAAVDRESEASSKEVAALRSDLGRIRIRFHWTVFGLASAIPIVACLAALTGFLGPVSTRRGVVVVVWTLVTVGALLGIPLRRKALEVLGIIIGLAGVIWMTLSLW